MKRKKVRKKRLGRKKKEEDTEVCRERENKEKDKHATIEVINI